MKNVRRFVLAFLWLTVAALMLVVVTAALSPPADGKDDGWRGPVNEMWVKIHKMEYRLNALVERCRERKQSFPYEVKIPGAGKAYCRCTWTEDERGNPVEEGE